MKPADFFYAVEHDVVLRRGRHVLYSALRDEELLRWRIRYPQFRLPEDLIAFYRVHNGFRLNGYGPYDETPESQDGLPVFLPLREVRYAAHTMFHDETMRVERIPASWFALTTDHDSEQNLVLDLETGLYYDTEPLDLEPTLVGCNIEDALEWCRQFLNKN